MSLTGSSNEEKIWNFLKSKINNNYGVAGLMGNLYAESGLNPQNLQNSYETKLGYTDATYTAAVDNGTYTNFVKDSAGYGLAQWTYYSRKQNLLDYIQGQNLSIGDLEGQLNFLYKELSSSYSSVLTTLKSATTVLAASNAVLTGYEKPADQSTSVQTKRASYGQTYYDKYATTTTSSNTGGTTMGYSRSVIVAQAQAWLGYNESDGTHKQIIDVYNAHTPLARSYKVQYTDAWCATFVSAVSIKCGYTAIIPTECSCSQMITLFKNLGEWKEDDSYTPSAGDIIFYDWQDSGSGDNTGTPDHVGIVEKVSGSTITVIEGNYSDSVKRRTIAVNGQYIRGYGLPAYTTAGTTTSSSSSSTTTTTSSTSGSSSTTLNKTEQWKGVVTASTLNVRTWAGTSNSTVSFSPLKKGAVVSVCDTVKASDGSSWYYIKYNSKYGFASASYISKQSTTTTTSSASSSSTSSTATSTKTATEKASSYDKSLAGTYKTTANKLNVRNGAGTGKSILVTIPKGTSVTNYGYYTTVSGIKWMYVQFTYNKVQYTGFCSKTYLTK